MLCFFEIIRTHDMKKVVLQLGFKVLHVSLCNLQLFQKFYILFVMF